MKKILNFLSSHLKQFFWAYIVLIFIVVGGIFYFNLNTRPICRSSYDFINPEPVCEISEQEDLESLASMKTSVNEYVKSKEETGEVGKISVFYRNLITRRWFGVNDNEFFSPASILKLPIAIAFLKMSEVDSDLLDRKLLYEGNASSGVNQFFKPPYLMESGKSYAGNDLIFRMLAYSDNQAVFPIVDFLNSNFLNRVFVDLGINIPVDFNNSGNEEKIEFVSVKSYASIFRSLYNASYLNRDNSEKILNMLNQSVFGGGLVAGVTDRNVKIAHKFGERSYLNSSGAWERQLHDCGIIYKPDNPYILCVMTKGENYESLEGTIQGISEIVYKRN